MAPKLLLLLLSALSLSANALAQVTCEKIGILGEFKTATGRTVSPFGLDIRTGVQVALDKLKRDGRKICFTTVEIDINNSIANIPGLIAQSIRKDGINIFLGLGISDQAIMATEVLVKHNALLITPTASSDELVGPEFRQIMLFPRNSLIVEALAKETMRRGLKKVAIISESNSTYSKNMALQFRTQLQNLGGTVTTTLAARKAAFSVNQICSLKADSPQAIFMPIFELDAARVISLLDKCAIHPLIIGADSWGTDSKVIQAATKAISFEAILPQIYPLKEKPPQDLEFRTAMDKNRINDLSAFSYDGILFLAKLMETCSKASLLQTPKLCVDKALPFESLTGPVPTATHLSLDRRVQVRNF
ncbi:MAG TPA: ABC transporter substrate-binding protein [Bdellovibrionota bacterium]|jgi:ABC-type branched-subunit amino acid transport system substrate-binding protein|nr:ABC transporter substrate-binding protein [Bdellovibrionota bacterium]